MTNESRSIQPPEESEARDLEEIAVPGDNLVALGKLPRSLVYDAAVGTNARQQRVAAKPVRAKTRQTNTLKHFLIAFFVAF